MCTNNNNYNLINGNIITLNNIVPIANSITICNGKIESISKSKKSFIASVISKKIVDKFLINDKDIN